MKKPVLQLFKTSLIGSDIGNRGHLAREETGLLGGHSRIRVAKHHTLTYIHSRSQDLVVGGTVTVSVCGTVG